MEGVAAAHLLTTGEDLAAEALNVFTEHADALWMPSIDLSIPGRSE
jgi:hypothetical protein